MMFAVNHDPLNIPNALAGHVKIRFVRLFLARCGLGSKSNFHGICKIVDLRAIGSTIRPTVESVKNAKDLFS